MSDLKVKIRDRFYKQIVDGGDFESIDALFSPDCKFIASGSDEPVGRDEFREYLRGFRDSLEFHHTIEALIAEDRSVAVRWTVAGTQRGEIFGSKPTGRDVNYTGVSIFRFGEDGLVDEVWSVYDELNLRRQVGLNVD